LTKWKLKLLNFLIPVTKIIGKLHAPFTHKKVDGIDVLSVGKLVKPGAIFLTYTRGELTNLFIPGEFSHLGICLDKLTVVEAIGKGVSEKDIISFMTSKDRVVLLYPNFCDEKAMERASLLASESVGKAYDYKFVPGNDAFYCSELAFYAYQSACGGSMPFEKRDRLGVQTVIPEDFYKAKNKWTVIWDSDWPN
jgi:uncharacterized protein YycO